MATYRLSRQADQDIDNIFSFGVERFSIDQATTYLLGLHDHFGLLVENPDFWLHITVKNKPFKEACISHMPFITEIMVIIS